jgi:hypothetical protein
VVKALEQGVFKDKSYFTIVKQDGEAVQADNLPEGEGNYHFDPHGVRDDEVKDMVKTDRLLEEGELGVYSDSDNEGEDDEGETEIEEDDE